MLYLVSPAKTMCASDAFGMALGHPRFEDEAEELASALRALGKEGARSVWKCSQALAEKAWDITVTLPEDMRDEGRLSPAAMSYIGIQYQHMAPQVMDEEELGWLSHHLRILSGLYGVLSPFDGVVPYRLEMQAKLKVGTARDLYAYWGSRIAESLEAEPEGDILIDLASAEYSRAVVPHVSSSRAICVRFLAPRKDGKLVQAAPEVKAARGTFVRWCAEQGISAEAELAGFAERGYRFAPELSDGGCVSFVREKTGKE